MTTKPKARKYRIRRSDTLSGGPAPAPQPQADPAPMPQSETPGAAAVNPPPSPAAPTPTEPAGAVAPARETDIDQIRKEGLTGRQLRMARRVAQKQGLAVTSDFDAVRQLRIKGIDPFQRSNILELVNPNQDAKPQAAGAAGKPAQLPQTTPGGKGRQQLPERITPAQVPSTELAKDNPAERRAGEIRRIQQDIARRRRKKMVMLFARLAVFVALPTLIVGLYFSTIASPMYATYSQFTVRQAESSGGGAGIGSLLQGTGLATQQDATGVQSYLQSRDAMSRLDADFAYKSHFSDPEIDAIQRLPENATNEQAFDHFSKNVKIGYDPTEGILKMEVIAATPEASQVFSEALISYAEERVDQQTLRLREDQMSGAQIAYEDAENRRAEALQALLEIQQQVQVVDPASETAAIVARISELEGQRLQAQIELETRLNVSRPNAAQVNALRSEISAVEGLIANLRNEMTSATTDGISTAELNTRLRLAEENYAFQAVLVQQALQQRETARIEANRQITYLTLNVHPVAPDEATYPRVFENTVLAFLILAGIYLMISLTASILREQVSS